MKHTGWIAWLSVVALLGISALGYFILRSGGATIRGSEMNVDRAVFNVANAVTLTGFQLTTTVNDYKFTAQLTIFFLVLTGSVVTLLVGGWGVVRATGIPISDEAVAKGTLICVLLAIVIGAPLLIESSHLSASIFDAISAFGNSGLWIGTIPTWQQARAQLVVLPLAVLGGLGIPVLLSLAGSLRHFRRLHRSVVDILVASALLYVLATLAISVIEWKADRDPKPDLSYREALVLGSTEVLNNRSLGLAMGSFGELTRPSQWICMILMLIGTAPGGAAGGCGAVFVYIFLRDSLRTMRGKATSRLFGLISLWLVIYFVATLTTTLFLVNAQPQVQSDRLLFLAASAIGNAGTSHEPLTLTGASLYILTGAMFFGRLAPLVMLWCAGKCFIPVAAVVEEKK